MGSTKQTNRLICDAQTIMPPLALDLCFLDLTLVVPFGSLSRKHLKLHRQVRQTRTAQTSKGIAPLLFLSGQPISLVLLKMQTLNVLEEGKAVQMENEASVLAIIALAERAIVFSVIVTFTGFCVGTVAFIWRSLNS